LLEGLNEFGHKTKRHALMLKVLGEIHPHLVELFNQVWFANGIEECPRIEEWHKTLEGSPVLLVEPANLDFGKVREGDTASASLTITNSGGGILSGQIIPAEPWVQVSPDEFQCARGQSSQHQVGFNIKTSTYLKPFREKAYHRQDFLKIMSNGNEKIKSIPAQFILRQKSLIAYAFLVVLLAGIGSYFLWAKPSPHPAPQPTHTTVASTITPSPSRTPDRQITQTLKPIYENIIPYTRFYPISGVDLNFKINTQNNGISLYEVYENRENLLGTFQGQLTIKSATFQGVYSIRDEMGSLIFLYASTAEEEQDIWITGEMISIAKTQGEIISLAPLRSYWNGKEVFIDFVNNSSVDLYIYRLDQDGNVTLILEMKSGIKTTTKTYYGNAWTIRDKNGDLVFYYIVTEEDRQTIIISEELYNAATY